MNRSKQGRNHPPQAALIGFIGCKTGLLLLCAFLLFLGMGSCRRDKCKRVVCVNGICMDGTCVCDTGYYGSECNSIINEGLGGTWNLTEECTAGSDSYEVTVEAPGSNKLIINIVGIWEQQEVLVAGFAANGTEFSIPRTAIGNVEIDATGTIDESRTEITLDYKVYNPGSGSPFDKCLATLTQQ